MNTAPSRERRTLKGAKGRRFGAVPPPAELLAQVSNNKLDYLDVLLVVPDEVDLRGDFPPVYDQRGTNACTAFAAAAMVAYHRKRRGLPGNDPSKSFIYFYDRMLNGIQTPDGGGSVLAALKGAKQQGYCFEHDWPYDPHGFGTQPSQAAQSVAAHHHASPAAAVDVSADAVKDLLARGYPVGIALLVYNSFYSADANDGVVPMPGPNEGFIRHAGVLVGYRRDGYLVMRNSWGLVNPNGGPNGDGGHYYLPPTYLQKRLVYECWSIQGVVDS